MRADQRDPYFLSLQSALRDAGYTQPTLVVDRARLDGNLAAVAKSVPDDLALRVVAKSLPSLPVIERAMAALGTDRLMTFNLPMLVQLAQEMPAANQLLGKPFPVAAAAAFLRDPATAPGRDAVHWLVDTGARLAEYDALAGELGIPLDIVLEIDVGFHRGGFAVGDPLADALKFLSTSAHLTFGGFMGYEPHVPKFPQWAGWRRRVRQRASADYQKANQQIVDILGQQAFDQALRNTAGSLTFREVADTTIANEVSLGSALVTPTDFDHPSLDDLHPAAFIAAPVLKSLDTLVLPGMDRLSGLKSRLSRRKERAVFIHGGFWKAVPVDPPGARFNSTFGRSSNQEMIASPRSSTIAADDFLFFRPTQSESVMQQFGEIAVYADGRIVDAWPVMPVLP